MSTGLAKPSVKVEEVQLLLNFTATLSESTFRTRLEQAFVDLSGLVLEAQRHGVSTTDAERQLAKAREVKEATGRLAKTFTKNEVKAAANVLEAQIKSLGNALLERRRERGIRKDALSVKINSLNTRITEDFSPAELFTASDLFEARAAESKKLEIAVSDLAVPDADLSAISARIDNVELVLNRLAESWGTQKEKLDTPAGTYGKSPAAMHHRLVETFTKGESSFLEPSEVIELTGAADTVLKNLLKDNINANEACEQLATVEADYERLNRASKWSEAKRALEEFSETLDTAASDREGYPAEVQRQLDVFRITRVQAEALYAAHRYRETLQRIDGRAEVVRSLNATLSTDLEEWGRNSTEIKAAVAEAVAQQTELEGETFQAEAAKLESRARALDVSWPPGGLEEASSELARLAIALGQNRENSVTWATGALAETRTAQTQLVTDAARGAHAQVEELRRFLAEEVRKVGEGERPPLLSWQPALPAELDDEIDQVVDSWNQVANSALASDELDSSSFVAQILTIKDRATQTGPALNQERLNFIAEGGEEHYQAALRDCDEIESYGVSTKTHRGVLVDIRDALDKALGRKSVDDYQTATVWAKATADDVARALEVQRQRLADWLRNFLVTLDNAERQLTALDEKLGKKSGADSYRPILTEFRRSAPDARRSGLRNFYEQRVAYILSLVAADLDSSSQSSQALKNLSTRIEQLLRKVSFRFKTFLTEEGGELTTALNDLKSRVRSEGSSSATEHTYSALCDRFNAMLMKENNLIRSKEGCDALLTEILTNIHVLRDQYAFKDDFPKLYAALKAKYHQRNTQSATEPFEALKKLPDLKTEVLGIIERAGTSGEDRAEKLQEIQNLESEARLKEERSAEEKSKLQAHLSRLKERYTSQPLAKDPELEKQLKAIKTTLEGDDLETAKTQIEMVEQRLKVREGIGADPAIDLRMLTPTLAVWRKAVSDYENQITSIAADLARNAELRDVACADPLRSEVLGLSGRFDSGAFDHAVRIVQDSSASPKNRLEAREKALSRIKTYRDVLKMESRFRELAACPLDPPGFTAPAALYRTMTNLERVFLMAVTR
ncbi:hypothetical protein [Aporhodopirellula aestuarii]|uniref:Uncharacterized protein n=1 Tax=Aporhodopirellula aestuarii TaxID=2950107 RepID=A0ABT0TZ69_9BACT|nr:hypothetical protein [Aporhodopirellula aestuarii]MCM2369899.1 hypothetical protein [Aporhodopirellula aestuarii]